MASTSNTNAGMSTVRRLALGLVCALLLAGCPSGSDGAPGTPGPAGPGGPGGPAGPAGPTGGPGLDSGSDLPGVVIAILAITGATGADGTFQIGDAITVRFTVRRDNGTNMVPADLTRSEIYVSGPTTNYQRVLASKSDVQTRAVLNADGSWSYTFADRIPANYLAPLNDSPSYLYDPGAPATEMTGRPLLPGTYTVGMALRKDYTIDGETFRDVGNAVGDFLFGGALVLAPREVVTMANCNTCHNELQIHGGNRRDVRLCLLCHTAGAEDRISADPAKATTGVSISSRDLIHRIHRGRELRNVLATANGTDPFKYEVIGFGESVHDYSFVSFPTMPGRTGFNQQTRHCEKCHDGASEADAWYMRPSRATCSSCHDDVNFDDGTRLDFANPLVSGGLLTKADLTNPGNRQPFHVPQADDASCLGCHTDLSPTIGVRNAHRPPLFTPEAPGVPGIIDLKVEILDVTGATGPGGTFLAGDTPMVTFRMLRGDGSVVTVAETAAISGLMAGPTGNYQKVLPTSGTSVNLRTGISGAGPFTVGLGAIPATYPAQLNNHKRAASPASYPGYTGTDQFTFDNGSGDLFGRALDAGTYTVTVWASRQFTRDGITYREASLFATRDLLVSTASTTATVLEPYAGIIGDTSCNTCHENLKFHGNGRRGVRGCILCHTSGAEDRARSSATLPSEAAEQDTIDFRVMIHKIHNARELTVVRNGGKYDLVGFSATPLDFSHGELPTMPGGAMNCGKCHLTDAYANPTERADVRVWAKACSSCHDSTATRAHIALNTLGTVTTGDPATTALESCAVCHGPGRDFAVEKVHKVR